MINDIKKDMIEQLSYFKETNPKGYMLYDDVQEMVDGVLEKHNGIYPDYKDLLYKYDSITTELQAYKDKEDKLRELIETYSCRFNKGFPYDKVLIVQGRNISENEYLDLEVILTDIEEALNEGDKQ